MQQKRIKEELTRVTECKIGATWNLNTPLPLVEVLKPEYWSPMRFPDRQMRVADRVEVTANFGAPDQPEFEIATLVVVETADKGRQVTVRKV